MTVRQFPNSKLALLTKMAVDYKSSNDADGATRPIVNEEINSSRTRWETVEVEEKSSSVAITVQMEVAKTLETLRVD